MRMGWIKEIEELLNNRTARAFLIIFFISTSIFLWAIVAKSADFVTNVASFSVTLMGVGIAGFLTFYLVDRELKRRQNLRTYWYYRFIFQMVGILLTNIHFYVSDVYRLLRFEDRYPLRERLISLVVVRTAERTLNIEAIDMSNLLREAHNSLYYAHQRMVIRRDYFNIGPNDLNLVSGLCRSTLNTLFPLIEEFRANVLNPAVRDIEDPDVINALFRCRESLNAFVLMHSHPEWILGLDFSENQLIFFDNYARLYMLLRDKLQIGIESTVANVDGNTVRIRLNERS